MSDNPDRSPDMDLLLEFLFRLGQAYLASGEPTAQVELLLRRIAAAYGMRRSRVVVFPTAIFLSLHDGQREHVTVAEAPTQVLRLDQIASVYRLGEEAQRGEVEPQSGLRLLMKLPREPARFGSAGVVGGHVILSAGLATLLMATFPNIVSASLLGAMVGVLKALNRDRPVLSVPLPVVAAMLVSSLAFLGIEWGLPIDPLYVLVPPLVTFLPGSMLTLSMVELAYGDMVSGSSRLITGGVQLVLLVFGLAAGAMLVGYGGENLVDSTQDLVAAPRLPWLAPIGVFAFGLGVYFHFSAPRNSLLWILLVLFVAFAVQKLSLGFAGPAASGFLGMLVVTPLSYLIQLQFRGPPAMVTFLPGFWILVPGVLSLLSVKYMLSDRVAALDGIVTALFAIVAIALGTLMGAAFYKQVTERLGAARLQLGTVERFFRGRRRRR